MENWQFTLECEKSGTGKILSEKYKRTRKLEETLKCVGYYMRSTSGASSNFQWCVRWADGIMFSANILCVLFVKISLIQDHKDPLELMEAELIEEELNVEDEV